MAMNENTVGEKIRQIQQRITQAAESAGRNPTDITLLAVSKTKPISAIKDAYQAGQRHFGENYLQEAVEKVTQLQHLDIEWHFIGPLQSNKTRPASENFDWVHTVDRLKIARRLSEQRPADKPPLNVCLQVNVDQEASKSGVSPEEALELAEQVLTLPNLNLRGLMAIPTATSDKQAQRRAFAKLAELLSQLQQKFPDHGRFDTLSMGMSGDMESAIAEGSTMVRIGTDIFGARDYHRQEPNIKE